MPTAVDVNMDIGEMVLKFENTAVSQKIEYSKIEKLIFSKETIKKFLRTVTVKTIKVQVRGKEEPIIISNSKVDDFDHIERYLRQMAEKYKVSIEN